MRSCAATKPSLGLGCWISASPGGIRGRVYWHNTGVPHPSVASSAAQSQPMHEPGEQPYVVLAPYHASSAMHSSMLFMQMRMQTHTHTHTEWQVNWNTDLEVIVFSISSEAQEHITDHKHSIHWDLHCMHWDIYSTCITTCSTYKLIELDTQAWGDCLACTDILSLLIWWQETSETSNIVSFTLEYLFRLFIQEKVINKRASGVLVGRFVIFGHNQVSCFPRFQSLY